jgi:hypothetical protein
LSLPVDQQDFPARWIATGGRVVHSERAAWLRWCYSMIDSALGIELRAEEVKFLSDNARRE